jgi:hypothetical protein
MRKSGIIRSAVFPVGGLGTGILPATTAAPKGLLPVVDKPLIHYAVEEALGAGVRQMVFVTNRNKRAIEDHFDKAYELESALALHNRYELLTELRRLFPPDVTYLFVRQPEPLGLGHAVGCARVFLSGEPFLVIVPDELVAGPVPAAAQLIGGASALAPVRARDVGARRRRGRRRPRRRRADGARRQARDARPRTVRARPARSGARRALRAHASRLRPSRDDAATRDRRDRARRRATGHARRRAGARARARRRALRLRIEARLPRGDASLRTPPPRRGRAFPYSGARGSRIRSGSRRGDSSIPVLRAASD